MAMDQSMNSANKMPRVDERRKIYGVIDEVLKMISELGEVNFALINSLNRLDRSSDSENKVPSAPLVKELPYEEMDMFQKIQHLRSRLYTELEMTKAICNRFNEIV